MAPSSFTNVLAKLKKKNNAVSHDFIYDDTKNMTRDLTNLMRNNKSKHSSNIIKCIMLSI